MNSSRSNGEQGTAFLWGAATSSHQVEGHNKDNDWWAFEADGRVDGGVRSGRAADHRRLFREDLRMARELGLGSYRFSFEWSRFEPREGHWEPEAFDWYQQLIEACEENGLVPMATLHHFTLPQWMAEKGGFAWEESPERFARFTSRIARAFGSRIPLWCTLNEPMVLIGGSYLGSFMPPGRFDPSAASRACHNLLKAHVLAYDVLKTQISKREGPFSEIPLAVGFAHNMLDFKAERPWHLLEVAAARAISSLYNDAWLEAVSGKTQSFGLVGVLPRAPVVKMALGRRTYDFIGVNYYTKAYVQWRPRTQSKERGPEVPLGMSFAKRKETASDLGWAIHPQGFAKILQRVAKYRAPIYVTENGIADAHDEHRATYLVSHLAELARAIDNGVDVRGYYHWSLLDNFEWIKGFWPRFGLAHVDYETMERKLRPSALLYRDVIAAHGVARPELRKIAAFQPKA